MTSITCRRARAAAALWLAAAAAAAQAPPGTPDLPLPTGSVPTAEIVEPHARYRLPTGPWTETEGVPVRRLDGRVERRAWRLSGRAITPGQILAPIRTALRQADWTILFDCASEGCGGFDFRFSTEVLPAPEMYVNLTNYRFLSAEGPDGTAALSVLASASASETFVQIVQILPDASEPLAPAPAGVPSSSGRPVAVAEGQLPAAAAAEAPDAVATRGAGVVAALERDGHAILTDMRFDSGAAGLGGGPVASLDAIADYLAANPDRRVLFVGHTDATGSAEANRRLSRDRAGAALAYLRDRHGLGGDRVSADGAGYLAPVASNLDPGGRLRNRRVEAVLLPGS